MSSIPEIVEQIHVRALEVSGRFKRAEAELLEVLQQAEDHRVYIRRGHSSLFAYVVSELGLAENQAYNLITVARKAREVPEIKSCLESGAMTLSKARRVAPVLMSGGPDSAAVNAEWIKKACELSSRQLEKEIARVRPEARTPERASYVGEDRVKLELGLSEWQMLRLRRAQDLLCQQRKLPVSLEETIAVLTGEYLDRHDPVEKAKCHRVKKGPISSRQDIEVAKENCARESESAAEQSALGDPAEAHLSRESSRVREAVGKLGTLRVVPNGARAPSSPTSEKSRGASSPESPRRTPIPADVLHEVHLRDQGRCTQTLADGSRCHQSRWVEIHHKIPVSQGGPNTQENLVTLCFAHHRQRHL